MICQKCGMKIPDDSEFCQYCGEKLEITTDIDENAKKSKQNSFTPVYISSTKDTSANQKSKEKHDKEKYCKKCGGHINNATKKCESCGRQYFKIKPSAVCIAVLAVFLVISVAFNVHQYYVGQNNIAEINELSSEVSSLNDKVTSLKSSIRNITTKVWQDSSELKFYEEYAAIVCDDGTKKYHVYDCEDCDTSSFWIYNIEAAEEQGYYPCSKCH